MTMHGLLAGKRLLVTGVISEASIAFATARLAQEQGAEVVVTGYGRLSLVRRVVEALPTVPPVIELDVASESDLAALAERTAEHVDALDGVLHAVAFAPPSCLGGRFLEAPWEDVATALRVSTYSLQALTSACLPLLRPGGSIVGLDFDASLAWPGYDWMGVAKAGLESATRYLAGELGRRGIRVNLVAAGPLRTVAGRGIPGFDHLASTWEQRAPLGWDTRDATPVARACVALLSDWFPATTGEIVRVDGGVGAVGC